MPTRVQIVLDAADPHALARFWAAALGYEVEQHGELVDGLLAAGRLRPEDVVRVDGQSAFRDVAACADPAGSRPRVFVQLVPEHKVAKNRVHLDLQVGAEAREAEVDRLTALGASTAWTTDDRGSVTTTMRDPEGNEFCVS